MGIRDRVAALVADMAREPQYAAQGATLFVDLERREIQCAFTPLGIARALLGGRGANVYYLFRLLDETKSPLDPEIPLIFGSGPLTGLVPSAARGNCTSWSPDSGVLMDCNAGDYFPSFLRMSGFDHVILYGRSTSWSLLIIREGDVEFRDAAPYVGLDNIDMRDAIQRDLGGVWKRDMSMVNITRAGENQVLTSGIMGGPKAIYARGGPGAKMGALQLKAIVTLSPTRELPAAHPYKPYNRHIAQKLLGTSVVKNALSVTGTPFLYKPSRILGAMGAKNHQETTWTEALDAHHIDPYRPGMEGCFRCPVNCRPLNDLKASPDHAQHAGNGDRYTKGDGPEYVTLGKFGPNLGIDKIESVIRLNNVCNDLGLDTASMGSSLAWAFELYQRGIITDQHTGGLSLEWGDAARIEQLLFMTSRREGFGNVLADSSRAVDNGHYPVEALKYRMTVKGLWQSDPHDARILKAFALGLAVATRGMDHLRNRVTLEINAKINDDPAFKADLYGGPVSAEPNSYVDKERAVRACEDMYAVGDAVGMCRFTTKLFNSPSLPGLEEFQQQLANVTGLQFSLEELEQAGLNIIGVERLINYRLGVRRKDDTLPDRWFDEPNTAGPYKGERIDRDEFDRMLSRFYEISNLTTEGIPRDQWRKQLLATMGV
jgi:aldehyde:ferredoxin oxidoreductase